MNKKIVIIGAGHGGLYAAELLSGAGADVTVYEKSDYENISHDRTDCIERKFFDEIGLPFSEGSFAGPCCSFVAPFSDEKLYIFTEEENRDVTVERRPFAHMLIERAKKNGTKFFFETEVEGLITEELAVKGIVVGGEKVYADLVIDASGLMSPFRGQLPSVLGITAMPDEDEVLNVYHVSYSRAPGVPLPEGKEAWKLYLKYKGRKCISWVMCENETDVGVLIGMVGKLTEEDRILVENQLRAENPIIGDEITRGGQYVPISIRYPSSMLVCEGYALVGDSAFMTIPLLGSGLANAIRAGKFLAEEIIKAGTVGINTLWNYQKMYYRKIGAVSCVIDSVKRGLLEVDCADLKYIFECGAITDDDVKAILNGGSLDLNFGIVIDKILKLAKFRGGFKVLLSYVLKGVRAAGISFAIPNKYDLVEVNIWKRKVDRAMKG